MGAAGSHGGRIGAIPGLVRTLLVAGLLAPAAALGQQYGFTQFTPQEGLAQSQVRCMAQDAQGYLWFGTLGGASRFDGKSFTNYALQEGLPDAQVNALLAARDGTMWLGCGTSLVAFDGRHMRAVSLPGRGKDQRVLALTEDDDGTLFIGTESAGVFRSVGGHIEPLPGYPPDTAFNVRALLALPDGGLLVGLRNGLLEWRNGVCTSVAALKGMYVSALTIGRDGTQWVGTLGYGLMGLGPNGAVQVYEEENGLLQENIRTLLVDARGRLWIATKVGVNLLEGGRLRAFTIHQGMPNDNVWSLLQDHEGGIWIGTDGAGVLRYAGDRFVTYTTTEGLCSEQVMCAVSDARGDLWLGTYGDGVCRMDGMAMINTNDGLPNNTVWCGLADTDSSLWFGTSDGLCRIVHGRVAPLDSALQLTDIRVLSLLRPKDGRLWCGTREGLFIIGKDRSVERIDRVGEVTIRGVRSLRETADGAVWLATDQGVVRMKDGRARRYATSEGSSGNTVNCLISDARGRLWMGTSNGLSYLDQERLTTLRLGQDFGSNYIGLLLIDPQGTLWAGTNNGIFHFDPDSLLLHGTVLEHITLDEGLRGMECNLNSGFVDRRGRLFFGTNAGFVMHDPARAPLHAGDVLPITYITALRSFLQPTDWKGLSDSLDQATGLPIGLHVVYRKNHLTFDYTAVALANGERVRFRYRLIGFDPDWLPATDARFASYSNLPQGDYTFEVCASDHAGRWGPVARFGFRITPPFWLRWWFFLACAGALAGLAYGVMRYRHVRRLRREKTRQLMLRSRMLQLEQQALNANMNRHFIFNALNSIQYYINRQDRSAANKYLTSFAKLIRKNLDASQTDTTSLAEELSRLELYLLLEHMRFKDKFRYGITVDPGIDTTAIEIPAMMLQPYVENSIWHGILPMDHPGSVEITVARGEEGRTRVSIVDDGIGIERSQALKNGAEGDHISRGIEITKGRADVLRKLDLADIRITGPEQIGEASAPRGTRVVIDLPSKNGQGKGTLDLQIGEERLTFDSP